jgi:muramoyltetrapeptide carboxypeptidase
MPSAAGRYELPWVSASAEERAADINAAFADPEVKLVLAAIGGLHSIQVLRHLDYELIAANPKLFQGYSDITVLHWALLRHAGLATLYGPALLTSLAEYPSVLPFTDHFVRKAWFENEPIEFEPAIEWTDELLDFDVAADLERPRTKTQNEGWMPLRGGAAEGPLVVGCLESIAFFLAGTHAWPDLRGAILAVEPADTPASPAIADACLSVLDEHGVLEDVAALVVGRPCRYSASQRELLWRAVKARTAPYALPVLANVDFGHSDPFHPIPNGVRARIDVDELQFETLESLTQKPGAA